MTVSQHVPKQWLHIFNMKLFQGNGENNNVFNTCVANRIQLLGVRTKRSLNLFGYAPWEPGMVGTKEERRINNRFGHRG